MEKMQQDLLQAIEANLPAEVGRNLRKRLEQAEAWESENGTLKRDNKALKKENKEMDDKMIDMTGREKMVLDQANANGKKEKELNIRENQFAKDSAEVRATEAEKRADQLKEVLGVVFKSPVYKRTYGEQNDGNYTSDYDVNGRNRSVPTNFPSSKETHEEITNE